MDRFGCPDVDGDGYSDETTGRRATKSNGSTLIGDGHGDTTSTM